MNNSCFTAQGKSIRCGWSVGQINSRKENLRSRRLLEEGLDSQIHTEAAVQGSSACSLLVSLTVQSRKSAVLWVDMTLSCIWNEDNRIVQRCSCSLREIVATFYRVQAWSLWITCCDEPVTSVRIAVFFLLTVCDPSAVSSLAHFPCSEESSPARIIHQRVKCGREAKAKVGYWHKVVSWMR